MNIVAMPKHACLWMMKGTANGRVREERKGSVFVFKLSMFAVQTVS